MRYHELRRRLPEAEILMGVGNLTELTDADTTGITMTLMGMVSELAIRNILVVQVSPHCRRRGAPRPSWRGASCSPPRPTAACRRATTPGLLALRDRRPFPTRPAEIAASAAEVGDANCRIEVAEDGIHVYNRDGHHVAADPFDLFPQLAVERDGAHAFYLGVELARAQVAHQLGKRYVQDNELRWGVAVPPPAEDRLHFVQRRQHAGGAPQGPPARSADAVHPREHRHHAQCRRQRARRAAGRDRRGAVPGDRAVPPFDDAGQSAPPPFACVNYTTDVRVFAGCVTRRRRDWPVVAAERIDGWRLAGALAHSEVEVAEVVEDELRPRFRCRAVHEASHAPVPRASTAPRRRCWRRRSWSRACTCCRREKVEQELGYLAIAIGKTAGEPEREAWGWLMAAMAAAGITTPELA